MNKQQAILFAFLVFFFNVTGKAQVNFNIILDNYDDSSVIITSYYGSKIKLVDSAFLNEGAFEFNNKNYPGGVYVVVDPAKKKLFEFIINEESEFTIYLDPKSPQFARAEGSKENELFFKHLQLRNYIYEKIMQLSDSSSTIGMQLSGVEIESQLDSLRSILFTEKEGVIANNPELFVAKLLAASNEIQIPDSISLDSLERYHFYKSHFWDHLELADERFIRTPIIERKLETYFNNIVFLNPDSTISAIDIVVSLARPSDETVSYLLWFFISKYQNPQYMGFDKVFVHLVDNYFLKEEVLNSTTSINDKLKERSDKLKPLLIGEIAPNLILMDTNDRFVSFRDLESDYTLLLFWDFNCEVCKSEIVELQELLYTNDYSISVYAVNTNNNLAQWKKEIITKNMNWYNVNGTHSITEDFHELYDISGTPRMFLLDNEKKIMAKYFKVDQLIPIIEKQFMKSKY